MKKTDFFLISVFMIVAFLKSAHAQGVEGPHVLPQKPFSAPHSKTIKTADVLKPQLHFIA